MFDLNEKKFGGTVIFNNGDAGLVKDVKISVEERSAGEPDTYPNYKLVVEDNLGKINQGFYYPKSDPQKSDEINEQNAVREVGRVMHIARAVLGADYVFPNVTSAKEAFDVLFKLIKENAVDKKFNIFATYGSASYPNKYLGLRYFNFIEPNSANPSRLRANASDLLTRLEQDAPASNNESLGDPATKKQNWL